MLKHFIHLFDHRLNLVTLLLLFWAIFWTLDGLDKFFDGEPQIVFASWASKGSVVDADNKILYTIQPTSPVGWFGVNYTDQMASYFKTIHISREAAIGITYTFASFEVFIGLLFLSLFIWEILPESLKNKENMFTDRTLHRLAYKASVLMFVILSVGYQIFGDRTRLWEVGTYMAMTLVAYDLWYRTDRFLFEMRKKKLGENDEDKTSNSPQSSSYN